MPICVVVATSVAEEGLDFPVSAERGRKLSFQAKGQALGMRSSHTF